MAEADGEDVLNRQVPRRAIRWRTKGNTSSEQQSGKENYVNPLKIRLVGSIRKRDVTAVKRHLQALSAEMCVKDPTKLVDEYAVSLLEHAVRSDSTDVVDQLLALCSTPKDHWEATRRALMFAIKINNVKMCQHIVNMPSRPGYHKEDAIVNGLEISEDGSAHTDNRTNRWWRTDRWKYRCPENTLSDMEESEFAEEMTPIVLAAQLERIEIIRLLIDECTPNIHPLTEIPTSVNHKISTCYVCQEQSNFVGRQTIEECQKAIQVYKALASPAYMFQAGVNDPILEAFIISNIMEKRKLIDPAFVEEYDLISQQCKKFSMELLGLCRTCDEVVTLLNCDNGIEKTHTADHTAKLPRLVVATYYNQKCFVAHPHCQQILQNIWYNGLPNWVCKQDFHMPRILIYVFLVSIAMPFILLLYILRVPYVESFVRAPVSKFIFDVSTFLIFLVLLFVNCSFQQSHTLGAQPTKLEILIMVWVTGYTVRLLRVFYRRRCFYSVSYDQIRASLYQGISHILFWIYFIIKIALWIKFTTSFEDPKQSSSMLSNLHEGSNACYAIASSLAVVNIYTFFKASSTLGPLQISLKSMLVDVIHFLILFLVVLSSFAIAFTTLYMENETLQCNKSLVFCSLKRTYETLFWNMFGYGDPTDVIMFPGIRNNVTHPELQELERTEILGDFLYGGYHVIVIIVLLNMLIAMMANTYNVVAKNSVMEWRFARTRLILSYVNDLGVMVPPLNLIPIRTLCRLVTRGSTCCSTKPQDTKETRLRQYEIVLERVSKRYWRKKEAEKRQTNDGGNFHYPSTSP